MCDCVWLAIPQFVLLHIVPFLSLFVLPLNSNQKYIFNNLIITFNTKIINSQREAYKHSKQLAFYFISLFIINN